MLWLKKESNYILTSDWYDEARIAEKKNMTCYWMNWSLRKGGKKHSIIRCQPVLWFFQKIGHDERWTHPGCLTFFEENEIEWIVDLHQFMNEKGTKQKCQARMFIFLQVIVDLITLLDLGMVIVDIGSLFVNLNVKKKQWSHTKPMQHWNQLIFSCRFQQIVCCIVWILFDFHKWLYTRSVILLYHCWRNKQSGSSVWILSQPSQLEASSKKKDMSAK